MIVTPLTGAHGMRGGQDVSSAQGAVAQMQGNATLNSGVGRKINLHPIQPSMPGHKGLTDGVAGFQRQRYLRHNARLVLVYEI